MKTALKILLISCVCIPAMPGPANCQQPSKPCEAGEIKPGKEKGKQLRFFASPKERVREALVDALKALEFEVKKDKENEIEASRKRHMGVFVGSGGESLVARLEEAEESGVKGTRITAETRKGFIGRAGQKSWSNAVLDQTECILKENKQ